MLESHVVLGDEEREIRFVGEILGSASSFRDDKERWIEMTIYRTRGGKYVVAGVGKTTVQGETERNWAHVIEEPIGVIEAMYLRDRDGVWYLTRTAKTAIERACSLDPRLRDAYRVEVVD